MAKTRHIEVEFHGAQAEWDVIGQTADGTQIILQCKSSNPTSSHLDAYSIRSEFLQLQSGKDLVKFLGRTGRFEEDETRFGDLTEWQTLVRRLLCAGPKDWSKVGAGIDPHKVESLMRLRNLLVHLPFDREGSVPVVRAASTLEAIVASVLVDYLNGVRYAACERKDCGKLFRIVTKRKRIFCSQYCGHLVSLRKKRAAAAHKKTKPAKHKKTGNR